VHGSGTIEVNLLQ